MKKNKTVFQGVATALITPFNDDGIDYEKFGRDYALETNGSFTLHGWIERD